MSIEEKVRSLRMRIRFHLNRMQAEQADAEILEFAREIERDALERAELRCLSVQRVVEAQGRMNAAAGIRTCRERIRSLIPAEPEEARNEG